MYVTQRQEGESGRSYALRTIKENIVRLELAPGSKVSESEIAAELGLSRTPVREALQELSRERIVEIYPQRGSMISLVDYTLVDEASFMRRCLECGVAETLAGKAGQMDFSVLAENLNLQEYYQQAGNPDKVLELDDEFHRLMFQLAGYENCYRMMVGLYVHFDRVRWMATQAVNQEPIVEDHKAIFQALTQGWKEEAVRLMVAHLARYRVDESSLRREYPGYFK